MQMKQQRLDHSNRILAAIRNVNRLITRATDSETLLQGACECLTETQGYYNAWIALMDENRKLIAGYEAGLGRDFRPLVEQLRAGRLTRCADRTLRKENLTVTNNPPANCADCPLATSYGGRGAMTTPISHQDRVFGLLSVSVPASYIEEKEDRDLVAEVAADLGHALYSMDASTALKLHRDITKALPNPMAILGADYRYRTVNEAYANFYGVTPADIIGRRVSAFYSSAFFETAIRPNLDRCLAGKEVRYETQVKFARAGRRWMEMHYFPNRNMDGAVTGVISVGADITAKKQNEQHLKQRLKELRAFHLLSELVEQSRDLPEILGGVPDILINALQHPRLACARIVYEGTIFASHDPCGCDRDDPSRECLTEPLIVNNASHGEVRVCYVDPPPATEGDFFFKDERQLIHAVAERLGHICARHRAEEALRASESRYRRLSENSPAVVYQFRMAPDGAFSCPYISENVVEMLGVSAQEARRDAASIIDLIDADQQAKFYDAVLVSARELSPYKQELKMNRNGEIIWLETHSTPTREPDGGVLWDGFFMDITFRKQAEKEMLLTLDAISEGVWQWNFKTHEMRFSPVYYTMLGYEPDAFPATYQNWKGLIHPDDMESATSIAKAFIETQIDVYENVFRMRTQSGQYRLIQARGRVVERDGNGAAVRMIGNHVDITDLKHAEAKLKSVEKRNQALLDHSPVCHKIVDLDFNLQYMSENGFKMLKLDLDADVYGKPYPFAFFPEAFRRKMTAKLEQVKATGGTTTLEGLASDVQDNEVWLDSTLVPVRDDDGEIAYLTVVTADATERKQAEKERSHLENQLQQAQKMEAVGRLAGGVAHDFNNMLSLIINYSDMGMEELTTAHPLYENLEEIKKAGQRSAVLTRQLLAFARKQTVAPKKLDLNATIEGMLKMLHRLIGEDIDLAWSPSANLWDLMMDPGQIDMILANLCVNARDAIADVGRVSIETGNETLDEIDCTDLEIKPGDYVRLSVSDTGCGMDDETQKHIFEPFFTTKEVGKGTGLGLATVFGVVKQNHGDIKVYSELGVGTTFKIFLPRHRARADHLSEKGLIEPVEGGRETVLLVEDESSILKLAILMLKRLGYRVTPAHTPVEAIRLAREHVGDIDLLMTDVIMPEMNGRDLAKKILSIHPKLKCLFMSGYTADVIAHHGVLEEGVNFIQKPFTRKSLSLKVRAALDRE